LQYCSLTLTCSTVFAAGHGDNGWKYVPRIIQSLAGQIVVQVTCGSYHTAAVTGNGDLYTWVSYLDGAHARFLPWNETDFFNYLSLIVNVDLFYLQGGGMYGKQSNIYLCA
jgi:Regulator of chromosome condensation (RCC1) repeat